MKTNLNSHLNSLVEIILERIDHLTLCSINSKGKMENDLSLALGSGGIILALSKYLSYMKSEKITGQEVEIKLIDKIL
jgi:hypothetical protein